MSEMAEKFEEQEEVICLDDMSAEMLLRQIEEANAECDRMVSWYKTMIERVQAKRDNTVAWAENSLRGYFEMVPKKTSKTQQSYELPSGKLVLKAQDPEYKTNDAELVPWLKANWPEFVKTKESSDWMNLKKQLKATPDGKGMITADGEIVPGITVTAREPKFTVTLK